MRRSLQACSFPYKYRKINEQKSSNDSVSLPCLPPEIWSLILEIKFQWHMDSLCKSRYKLEMILSHLRKISLDAVVQYLCYIKENAVETTSTTLNSLEKQKLIVRDFRIMYHYDRIMDISPKTQNLLLMACRYGADMVEEILEAGYDVNFKSKYNTTALMVACISQPSIVNLLLQNGARTNDLDSTSKSALIYACCYNVDVIKNLMDFGCDVNSGRDIYGNNALIYCCRFHPDLVPALIEAGSDLCYKNYCGNNALMYAVKYNPQLVPCLIESGCDTNSIDMFGYTPLMVASQFQPTAVIPLIESGCNLHV
eukprot:TRINITY_DN5685_c0_g1_i1.p1 TRINITY_DN5685_c0_g1~~TRINITY_DN5685_c0_g1_i1.p1  ORF type:complete len:311 (+),score=44.75 TRINITY_DN5685_c0_g1_i1:15-947(+)